MNICVFCASSNAIDPSHVLLAAEVGNEIARRGHGLVSGGGSVSCMGAVARATRDGGGYTVGVIPHALLELEVSDPDAHELIVTDTMRERKGIMDARSDAFLTLPGGLGTLEELLEIWTARVLGLHDKPVVVLDPDGVFAHLRRQVDEMTERGFVRPAAHDALRWTSTIAEAFDELEKGVATADQLEATPREALETIETFETDSQDSSRQLETDSQDRLR